MDIGVFFFTSGESADPAIVAKKAEDLGFASIWAPETPRAAPTTNASRMRGNLIVVMMARSASEAVVSANPRCSSKMPMVRDGGMVKGPTAAATITSTIPATARTADPRPSFSNTGVLLNSETARSHPARRRTDHLPARDFRRSERRCGTLELADPKRKIPVAITRQGLHRIDLGFSFETQPEPETLPMAKSDCSAKSGRSPGFRIITHLAPSHPSWTVALARGYPITVAPPQRILTAFPICARSSSTTSFGWLSRFTLPAVADVVNTAFDGHQVLEFRSVNAMRLSAAWSRSVSTSGSVMLPDSSMKLATWGRRTRGWWRTYPPSDSML